jgi:hypothetical protein
MNVISISHCPTKPAPKEWEHLPTIVEAKSLIPFGKYEELSLQQLELPDNIQIVQWWGSVKGFWYQASNQFLIM